MQYLFRREGDWVWMEEKAEALEKANRETDPTSKTTSSKRSSEAWQETRRAGEVESGGRYLLKPWLAC